MKVISNRMVFIGGSRVPAGTPFEVADDAKMEPGMTEVAKPDAKAAEPAPKDEPKTLAEVAAADAKAAEPKGAKGQARV